MGEGGWSSTAGDRRSHSARRRDQEMGCLALRGGWTVEMIAGRSKRERVDDTWETGFKSCSATSNELAVPLAYIISGRRRRSKQASAQTVSRVVKN